MWNKIDTNGICVSILTKFTVGYLGVKGKLHNSQCLIYIFTGKVIDGSPKIFTKYQYNCWLKELRDHVTSYH